MTDTSEKNIPAILSTCWELSKKKSSTAVPIGHKQYSNTRNAIEWTQLI